MRRWVQRMPDGSYRSDRGFTDKIEVARLFPSYERAQEEGGLQGKVLEVEVTVTVVYPWEQVVQMFRDVRAAVDALDEKAGEMYQKAEAAFKLLSPEDQKKVRATWSTL